MNQKCNPLTQDKLTLDRTGWTSEFPAAAAVIESLNYPPEKITASLHLSLDGGATK